MRKRYLLSLENRTPEQIAEEEALFVEIKRLEQNERRFKREREELLRTLVGIESGLPDIPVDEEGLMGLTIDMKRKKKGGGMMDFDSPSTPSNIISLGPPMPKRIQSAKSAAYGLSILCGHLISLIRTL
jgi:DNA methyltransferase 1-associated protein 1